MLDKELDSYWGKCEDKEIGQKKLDEDLDDYWNRKDEVVVEAPVEKAAE